MSRGDSVTIAPLAERRMIASRIVHVGSSIASMEKERMTQAEQAVLLWPTLALAARTQQILSYAAFEGYTGIAITRVGFH
jgi:hypothetical protein